MAIPDSLDEQLVKLLGQDARQSSEVLAKQLNVNSATVRRRLRNLICNDVLRIIGVIDPNKFGYGLSALICFDIENDKVELVLEELVKQPEIRWASATTGRWDIIALGRFRSTDILYEFLRKFVNRVQGVKDTETVICLDVKKARYVQFI